MKKVISLTLTLAMVLSLIVPIGAVGSTTPNTLKWDAKYTNALIIEAERNITRKNADGDKITSNTNNEDFEGLYFYWNDKQKGEDIQPSRKDSGASCNDVFHESLCEIVYES